MDPRNEGHIGALGEDGDLNVELLLQVPIRLVQHLDRNFNTLHNRPSQATRLALLLRAAQSRRTFLQVAFVARLEVALPHGTFAAERNQDQGNTEAYHVGHSVGFPRRNR